MSHSVLFQGYSCNLGLSFLKPFNPKEGVRWEIRSSLIFFPSSSGCYGENSSGEVVTSCGHGNRIFDIQSGSHKLNETIVFIVSHPHLWLNQICIMWRYYISMFLISSPLPIGRLCCEEALPVGWEPHCSRFCWKMSFNNWCWLAHKAKQTSEKWLDPGSIKIQLLSFGGWRLYGVWRSHGGRKRHHWEITAPERQIASGNSYRALCLGSNTGILVQAVDTHLDCSFWEAHF